MQQVVLLFTGITLILSLRFELALKEKCMNQKAKPHKQSLVVEDQNDMGFGFVLPPLGGVRLQ